ncbi:CBS domain-containing protein [Herminiimonas sp. CN]|uniref:CBS domain-containing protein n=1 Tax=Herminiimonas sp. CN TaxID=1349818 RepID=UPI001EE641F9|nr:CBS domain-containing protein [Herminiimonas sp. CN]
MKADIPSVKKVDIRGARDGSQVLIQRMGAIMGEKMNAGEICNRTVVFAYKYMSVSEAARLMLEQHVGSLVVIEETERGRVVIGMLTDRDIAVAVVAHDFDAQALSVADVMSKNLITARIEDSVYDLLHLMRGHGVRRIPVITEYGVLIGIVTLDDLLEIVTEQLRGLVLAIESERKRETRVRE